MKYFAHEWKKVFKHRTIWLLLLGEAILTLALLLMKIDKVCEDGGPLFIETVAPAESFSFFYGGDLRTVFVLFFLPLFVSVSAALTFFEERKNRTVSILVSRGGNTAYHKSKIAVTFITSFIVTVFPFLLSVVFGAVAVPLRKPVITMANNIYNGGLYDGNVFAPSGGGLFEGLYYNQPILQVVAITLMMGVYLGLIGLFAYIMTFIFKKNIVICMVMPVVLYLLINLIPLSLKKSNYVIGNAFFPGVNMRVLPFSEWELMAIFAAVFILFAAIIIIYAKRHRDIL